MTTLGNRTSPRVPQGMKVAPTSYAKLEEMAERLGPLLPMDRRDPGRIDAGRLLEQTLPRAKYNYAVCDVAELEDCAAFTIPDQGLVVIRADVYEGIYLGDVFSRSTVVHELAHIVLQHAVTLHRGATLGQHKFYEDSEWQAKALTAAAMMPLATCKSSGSIVELAERCGTSVQAATFRVQRLVKDGLLSPY